MPSMIWAKERTWEFNLADRLCDRINKRIARRGWNIVGKIFTEYGRILVVQIVKNGVTLVVDIDFVRSLVENKIYCVLRKRITVQKEVLNE